MHSLPPSPQEERVRWTQLEGELSNVRREYDRCQRELESVEMQALRAQQAAEHNLRLLANAQDQLFAVQVGAGAAGRPPGSLVCLFLCSVGWRVGVKMQVGEAVPPAPALWPLL